MNKYDQDDLEAFLVEADLINKKVTALAENRMSPEEFDRLEVLREEDRRKREGGKIRRQKEAHEKVRQGRDGKGITKDFQNFCRFCHRQYTLPTPICMRCNKNTMTLQERQEQLTVMVGQYQDKKKSRLERKDRWDKWQKTKSMLWKKTSNSYDKWDYFISDSQEQQESDPIVPKNDPNFMALEKDMEERKQMRRKDTIKAKKLKQKGNVFMKEGKYQDAMEQYTLALEFIRDMKSIYTNRALAFIKLGKYKKAIADCTNVIEYMECFEKSTDNKDVCFKAHLRRAVANKELKNFKEALEDTCEALTYYPKDKQAEILKKQIEGFIEHKQKVDKLLRENKNPESQKKPEKTDGKEQQQINEKEQAIPTEEQSKMTQKQIIKELAEAQMKEQAAAQMKEQAATPVPEQQQNKQKEEPIGQKKLQFANPIEEIKYRLQNLDKMNIEALFILFKKNPEMVSIFIAGKGIKKCLDQMMCSEEYLKEGYLVSRCLRGDGVGEKQVWDFKVSKIYKRISDILSQNTEMSISKYFILEDFFEILIPLSLHEKYRELLGNSEQTFKFIEQTFARLVSRHKKQPDLFSSFLIYAANLCSGNSKLRDQFISGSAFQVIVGLLYQKVITRKTLNRSYLNLRKNVYNLFANMIINTQHRNSFITFFKAEEADGDSKKIRWDDLVKQVCIYPKTQQNFNEYIESLLSVFTNATLGTSISVDGLCEALIDRYLSNPQIYTNEILHRAVLTLSRVKHTDLKNYKNMLKCFSSNLEIWKSSKGRNLMEQIIRSLNLLYMGIQGKGTFTEPLPQNILKQCKLYISSFDYGETIFCNTCNLFGLVLDNSPECRPRIYSQLKPIIIFLISVAKDKVGNWRKNSSILLAKLSLNPQCKEELYKNHGMDVLKSIAQFVKK